MCTRLARVGAKKNFCSAIYSVRHSSRINVQIHQLVEKAWFVVVLFAPSWNFLIFKYWPFGLVICLLNDLDLLEDNAVSHGKYPIKSP